MKRSEIRGILDSATLRPGYELRAASCELSDLLHNEELIGGKIRSVAIIDTEALAKRVRYEGCCHGYPMPQDDPFRNQVLKQWKPV